MGRDIGIAVFLVLATAAVFRPVVGYDFVSYDDPSYVYDNKFVREGLGVGGLGWAMTATEQANWHPLTWLSHRLDWRLFGPWAGGHHLTSVLLHAANAVLLFWLLKRMTGARWPSAVVAALFAVHPLHVESVAWVAERKDVLSTFFGLLALLAYVRYAARPSVARYVPVFVLLALGLMAKPMLVTLPFVMLLLDYWPLRRFGYPTGGAFVVGASLCGCPAVIAGHDGRPHGAAPTKRAPVGAPPCGCPGVATNAATGNKTKHVQDPLRHGGSSPWHTLGRLVLEKLPLFALVVASCIVTYLAQQQGGAMKYAEQLSPATRLANAPVVYVAYLGKAVCPTALAVFYPYTDRPTLRGGSSTWAVALAAAFLLTITVLVVAQVRRRPFLAVGWFWFVGMLLPVIGLVQVGKQAMADRYTYLPLVGIFLAVAWELRETPAAWRYRSAALTTLAVVALAVCVVLASSQVRTWENSHTLYEHALAVTENNALAHGNYGTLLFNEGKFDEAAGHYAEALRIDPDQPGPLCNAGLILYSQGRREEALARYREAVRLDPTLAVTRGNLGTLLREMGQAAEAERELREAVRLQPDGAEFHAALGCALSDLGRSAEAIEQFSESLRLRPDVVATHTNMATTLMTMGRLDEALAHLGEAIRLAPNEAPAYVNRGLALVAQGKLEEGIASYRRALQIAPNLPGVHNNLGLALVTQGKTDEGVAEYREAIRLDSRYANPHYNWAIVLARAGKTDEAVAHLEEALRLRPGWTEAAELLRALRGAAR